MLVIPTALIGVVFGHLALGLNMTMPSMVGMASLFGVVVNDSILDDFGWLGAVHEEKHIQTVG